MDVFPITVDEDVYEIPVSVVDDLPPMWQRNATGVTPATYLLKMSVKCPHCGEWMRSVHVVGLGRAEKTTGSEELQRSLVVTCPECDDVVPHELAGL